MWFLLCYMEVKRTSYSLLFLLTLKVTFIVILYFIGCEVGLLVLLQTVTLILRYKISQTLEETVFLDMMVYDVFLSNV